MKRIKFKGFTNPFTLWAIIAAVAFAACVCASALTITRNTAERATVGDGLPAELRSELTSMSDEIYTWLLSDDMFDNASDERKVALAVANGSIIEDAIDAGARVRLLTGDGSVLYDSNNSPITVTYDGKYGDSGDYSASKNGTLRVLAAVGTELTEVTTYYSDSNGSAIEYGEYLIPARTAALISGDGAAEYYTLLYTALPLGEGDSDYAQCMADASAPSGEYMLLMPVGRDDLLIFTFSIKNSALMAHVSSERHILYGGVQQVTLLLIFALTTGLAFIILLALWVFRDARARGARAALWGTLVILGNVVAFAIYLMVRPEK